MHKYVCQTCKEPLHTSESKARKRWVLGYKTCMACGSKEADKEIEAKSKRIAPAFNKGGYTYLGDPETAKRMVLDVGRKDGMSFQQAAPTRIVAKMVKPDTKVHSRHKPIGQYRSGKDWIFIYTDEDLQAKIEQQHWVVRF